MRDASITLQELLKRALGSERMVTKQEIAGRRQISICRTLRHCTRYLLFPTGSDPEMRPGN